MLISRSAVICGMRDMIAKYSYSKTNLLTFIRPAILTPKNTKIIAGSSTGGEPAEFFSDNFDQISKDLDSYDFLIGNGPFNARNYRNIRAAHDLSRASFRAHRFH